MVAVVRMRHTATSNMDSVPTTKAKVARARSVPSARPFRVAVFFSSVHYLCLVATLTALIYFFVQPCMAASRVVVGGLVLSLVTWFVAFFKRRGAHCPLCKGTPLINSGARVHIRARRIPPLNHGVSATLSVLGNQKFRCMYCGSDYDLLKPRTRLLYGPDDEDSEESDKRA